MRPFSQRHTRWVVEDIPNFVPPDIELRPRPLIMLPALKRRSNVVRENEVQRRAVACNARLLPSDRQVVKGDRRGWIVLGQRAFPICASMDAAFGHAEEHDPSTEVAWVNGDEPAFAPALASR